ncbi:MAG: hypothetical protein ACREPI_11935 [Candidatus Dormibacterales bacterium]
MYRLGLLARSLRWRGGASLTLLMVATAAITAAAGGPIYAHGGDETVLHNTLDQAPVPDRGLTLAAPLGIYGDTTTSLIGRVDRATSAMGAFGLGRWFARGVRTVQSSVDVPSSREHFDAELVSRQGACSHLTFAAGRCPLALNEVAISERSAKVLGVHVGSPLPFYVGGVASKPLRVVGVYLPGNAQTPYWWGLPFFDFFVGSPVTRSHLDSLFVTDTTVEALPVVAFPDVTEQVPLRVNRVHADGVGRLLAGVHSFTESDAGAVGAQVSVETKLPEILGQVRHQQGLMEAIVAVIDAELVLLALVVLYAVVARTSEAREQEVALAKLRGFRTTSVMSVGLLEPALLLCFAFPLGLGIAVLAVRLLASRTLLPGTAIGVTPPALLAASAAFGGGLVAAGLGAHRILTRRVAEQLRPAAGKRAEGRGAAVADGAAVALALAGLVELAASGGFRSGQSDPVAVLAPGLIALAAGVAGLRVLPLVLRMIVWPTANSRWVGTFLAVRQAGRRPSTLRLILPVTIAVGLATYAVSGWSVAGANRAAQAAFQVGAARVLTVRPANGVDLLQAVRRADPGGGGAMAVEQYQSATSGNSLLAVDSARLAAVAEWPPGTASLDPGRLHRWLAPPLPEPVYLAGRELRLSVSLDHPVRTALDLEATVSDDQGGTTVLDLGDLVVGSRTYSAALPSGCAAPCRLVALTPIWVSPPPSSQVCIANCVSSTSPPVLRGGGPPAPVTYQLVLGSVQVAAGPDGPWREVDAGLDAPHRWRPSSAAVQVGRAAGTSGLAVRFQDSLTDVSPPALDSGAIPSRLPAVVTPEAISLEGSGSDVSIAAQGLDDNVLLVDGRVNAPALPRLGVNGVLVDLTLARRARTQTDAPGVQDEVWLSPSASGQIVQRLRDQGLTVVGEEAASALRARLDHQGPALGYDLFLLAAGTAALLALGAAVFAIFVTARRRSYELAVLMAMGVARPALLRGLLGEQALVLGAGLALGVGSGLAGAVLGLPAVPELVDQSFGPPLDFGLPWLALGVLVATLAAALALAAALVALAVMRTATPARLRVAPA